jgi:hypothetical protein
LKILNSKKNKTHRIITQKPEMHSDHTSPHISWQGKKMEFKEPKIIKTFFILEKRNSVFHQKIEQKIKFCFPTED